jgi:hypothetical protein
MVLQDDGGTRETPDDSVRGRSRAVSWKSTTAGLRFSFARAWQEVSGDLHAWCAPRRRGQAPAFIEEQQELPFGTKIPPNGVRMQIRDSVAMSRDTGGL